MISKLKHINHTVIYLLVTLYACHPNFDDTGNDPSPNSTTYYIDSENGDDGNRGNSTNSPWKSLSKLNETELHPGDVIRLKRGSEFAGRLVIKNSGTKDHYIKLTDYGDPDQPAPKFTNPTFRDNNFGNCIRIKGDYVLVENLHFHDTASFEYLEGQESNFLAVWEMGAIHIDKGADHCIIRNNEIENCPAGIRSYGHHAIIEHNYIHDCNRILKKWSWGPIGIWLGGDYQEVRYNRIFNYRAEDPRIAWPNGTGGGADGGAIEIDDARFDKSHISIHHNYTRDNQGFLEVTWSDVESHPEYENFQIHHNISNDYQQFIALWNGRNCRIDNNTIIRRKVNVNDWGVFNITENNSQNRIRNNIIITEKDIQIFNVGLNMVKHPDNIIQNNLFFAASGELVMGNEGPGDSPVYKNPLLDNYPTGDSPEDFAITANSPAIDHGSDLNYELDFRQTQIPKGNAPDIGAFEFNQ